MKPQPDYGMQDIESLVCDRKQFEAFVYTPVDEALATIRERRKDPELEKKVMDFLNGDIPEPFMGGVKAVLVRNVVTPNYETVRFLDIVEALSGVQPLLAEYPEDKFVPSNNLKRLLCKIGFYVGRDRNGALILDRVGIVNFDAINGSKMSQIKTLWGQPLVDFHHEFFLSTCSDIHSDQLYDISSWYKRRGGDADKYYLSLLCLFVKHGILFENFLLEDPVEASFAKNVFLPAYIRLWNLIGEKPLIVSLEPTKIEGDKFWLCYPYIYKHILTAKLN